ncbi:MAG: hypothetical protein O2954_03985 [bacterium]|nr:hypothetical protein [bacterium]
MSHSQGDHQHRHHKYPTPPSLGDLGLEVVDAGRKSGDELTKLKRFRFQLLHSYLVATFDPCRVADIGGGKGFLAYLLRKSGWDATVIDPENQPLPTKFKDLETGQRIRIGREELVPRLDRSFESSMAEGFDLLIGLHAHGCNLMIMEAAKAYGCNFVLMPCCVIDEPVPPPRDTHWLPWLANQAKDTGFLVEYFKLNFKGQSIGFSGK